jgi:lysyl-tRNA synthetase, class II
MPDKMHGIADPELRRRFRYADLIADSLKIDHEEGELTTREVFERRAKLISGMRNYLDAHGYTEVETPMLTPKATGAAARAFATHHNALDLTLYARIAPELYLKRLLVGGFEKVYELNRNFRNEGLSHKHNPEFTMLEFYCAYMDVNGMMDFAETMIKEAVQKAAGSLQIRIGEKFADKIFEKIIDFSKFERLSMKKVISQFWQSKFYFIGEDIDENYLDDLRNLLTIREFIEPSLNLTISLGLDSVIKPNADSITEFKEIWHYSKERAQNNNFVNETHKPQLLVEIFEELVEETLIQPTFIIDYPKSISPLSKASPENPQIAERFELFINGMECANGFSELNDPQEQYERFMDQMKERESGDHEAMVMDEDYIRALAYGMPPAAGIGIGIDRLVMLLTNKHSIRDVILFPHMRPEKKDEEKESLGEKKN